MDVNLLLGLASLAIFVVLLGFFGYAMREQDRNEEKEPVLRGVELLRQHYPAGATLEQPTPYWVAPIPSSPDPLEISANLDKKIVVGAGMLLAVFVLIGAYFLKSGEIQQSGVQNQLEQRITRGQGIYTNLCYDCHGPDGQGISGAGLPLNTPANKYEALIAEDPSGTKLKERSFALRRVIERGRVKPAGQISMPPWLRSEGGPLNDEQVQQILAFIQWGTPDEWADVVVLREELGLAVEPQTPKPVVVSGADGGKALTQANAQQACTTCHSFDANKPSLLPLAPNLSDYGVKGPINAELQKLKASDPDWLTKWIAAAPTIKPGIAMPSFGQKNGGQLTDDNIKAIVEYLQVLGTGKEPK